MNLKKISFWVSIAAIINALIHVVWFIFNYMFNLYIYDIFVSTYALTEFLNGLGDLILSTLLAIFFYIFSKKIK